MNAPNLVSPDNAPRDLEGLNSLTRPKKYNLALALNMFASENEESAFVEAEEGTQAQALHAALVQYDTQNGGPPQQSQQAPQAQDMNQQPPPPPGAPQPNAITPQYGAVTPQPLAAAPQPPNAPGYGGPPPGQPQGGPPPPQPGQYAQTNMAAPPPPPAPHPGYQQNQQAAPPPPMPPQGHYAQPTQGPPPGQPAMPPAPPSAQPPMPPAPQAGPPQGPPPGHYAQPGAMQPQMQPQQPQMPPAPPQQAPAARQPQTTGDPSNTGSEIEQLKSIVLGVARTQNMLGILLLELCAHHMGMDKPTLASLAVRNSQQGEPERLFEQAASQGKVG